jgi:adenylosuccinate lyase
MYEWMLVTVLIHFGVTTQTEIPVSTEAMCETALQIVLKHPKTIKARCEFLAKRLLPV